MKEQDYHTSIVVNATAKDTFRSINNVSEWWTKDLEGRSEKPNDVFTVHFGETFITVKIVELIKYSKIRWHVVDCYKHWLKDKKEWKDTTMTWEILEKGDSSLISFTHVGLMPGMECYKGCEKAWDFYVKVSLLKLLGEGKGMPELK